MKARDDTKEAICFGGVYLKAVEADGHAEGEVEIRAFYIDRGFEGARLLGRVSLECGPDGQGPSTDSITDSIVEVIERELNVSGEVERWVRRHAYDDSTPGHRMPKGGKASSGRGEGKGRPDETSRMLRDRGLDVLADEWEGSRGKTPAERQLAGIAAAMGLSEPDLLTGRGKDE